MVLSSTLPGEDGDRGIASSTALQFRISHQFAVGYISNMSVGVTVFGSREKPFFVCTGFSAFYQTATAKMYLNNVRKDKYISVLQYTVLGAIQ